MANDPTNPGGPVDPVKQYGTPSEDFAQSGTGTPSIDPAVQQTLDALGQDSTVLLSNMQKLVATLTAAKTPAADLDKSFAKWKDQLKYAVDASEDVRESLKEVLDINKKFATVGLAGMNKKSYAEVKRYLTELDKAQRKLNLNKSFLSKEGQLELKHSIDATERSLRDLEGGLNKVGDANAEIDTDTFLLIAKNAKKAVAETAKLGSTFARGGKLSAGVQDIAKIMGSGMFEKFARAGSVSKELNDWIAKTKQERAGGGGGGTGFLSRFAAGAPGEGGGLRGFAQRQVGATLEAGGGRAAEGLGMRALTGIAGAGEGVTSLLGQAAVPLAIMEGIRRLIDKVGEDNREILQKLGTGGLFTGARPGQNAQDMLQAVRDNLSPVFLSSLGVRREENLKIVQAIEELGVSLPELAQQQAHTGQGILQGGARGFGGVQELAYRQGRILGLDTGDTARTNIKYILQYKQSQQAVNNLFDQFIKDTKASGITTTKYLSLIDDITSQFDRMGKSLKTVTGIMSVLGSTGVSTADDLKTALTFFLGSQNKTLEQTAFIYSAMSQQQRQGVAAGLGANVGAQRATAQGAMANIGMGGPLDSIDDVRLAIEKLNLDSSKRDSVQGKEVKGALDDLLRQMQLEAHAKQFAAGGENAVDYAAAVLQLGTATTKMTSNIAGVLGSLSKAGATLNDVLTGKVKNQALLTQLGSVYGNAPDWQQQASQALQAVAGATVKVAATNPEKLNDSDIKDLYNDAVRSGLTTAQSGITPQGMRDAVSSLAAGADTGPKLAVAAETDTDLLMKLVEGNSSVVKAVQDSLKGTDISAENIATVTRTTGEAIEDVIAKGFADLAKVITWIADFLQNVWGKTPATTYAGAVGEIARHPFDTALAMVGGARQPGATFQAADMAPGGISQAAAAGVNGVASGSGIASPVASHATTINTTNNNATVTVAPPTAALPINRAQDTKGAGGTW